MAAPFARVLRPKAPKHGGHSGGHCPRIVNLHRDYRVYGDRGKMPPAYIFQHIRDSLRSTAIRGSLVMFPAGSEDSDKRESPAGTIRKGSYVRRRPHNLAQACNPSTHGGPMRTQKETETLVEHIEDVLRRLACGNNEPPGSCCACLQDVDTRGHLPSCAIHLALIAIEEWWE